MNSIKALVESQDQKTMGSIEHFFRRFGMSSFLHRAGIRKRNGTSPIMIILAIFCLPFVGKSFFRELTNSKTSSISFGKDAIYEFLNNPQYNWRSFLARISTYLINVIFQPLTNPSRERVLILDDSTYPRLRSRAVELLATVYDHSEKKFIRGFRLLTLGWSDGVSFLPLDFSLLSSNKCSNRLQPILKMLDKRTCGYKRRLEAMSKSTDLIVPMVKRALHKVKADYILMDSWFSFPVLINALANHLNVICMLKRLPNFRYEYRGRLLDLEQLYRAVKKRRGKAKILASVIVTVAEKTQVKIVFVRDRGKGDWLALLTTDVDLPNEEVVRIYGKRWDIEVFFKMCKHHLKLTSEIQIRDFDGITAHTTIVMIRYLFLALEQRESVDERTIGELFHHCCEEMEDITMLVAFKRILTLTIDKIRKMTDLTEKTINQIIDTVMGVALTSFRLSWETNPES